MTSTPQPAREALAETFERFASRECHGSSPLYEQITRRVAGDPVLLDLAARAASRPVPNLLLGAVQFLLRREPSHPLAAFYPTITGAPAPQADPYPAFRSFCAEHAEPIAHLLRTRRVQTNEVRRCAVLLPAFGIAAAQARGRPLTLIELGASAGLNLRWDRYGYDYGGGLTAGDPAAPIQLACEVRGDRPPPIPRSFPQIAARLGIDLHPIDLHDQQAVDWLRALIWPEHIERLALLDRAIAAAQQDPPEVLAGDALDHLPGIMAGVPDDSVLCIFHTFVVNQWPPEARARLAALLDRYGAQRDMFCIAIGGASGGTRTQLDMQSFLGGAKTERTLALCDGHANWIEWLESAS